MSDTQLDIEPIKARHAAATKGPFHCCPLTQGHMNDPNVAIQRRHTEDGGFVEVLRASMDYCDGVFYAASWQDVADLLAEVERLRAENARLKLTAKHPPAGTIQPFGETEMGKWIAEQSKRPPSNVHIGGNESLIPKE